MLLLIIGIILLIGLVILHELGHFYAARRAGIEVEEFGIGFPPRAWKKKLNSGLLFTINWLPLGGFVKLKGEHDSDTTPGSFGAASLGNKVLVMIAGVVVNLLTAVLLLTVLQWVGMPKLLDNQFAIPADTTIVRQEVYAGLVAEGSPAEAAGLRDGDRLISIREAGCTSADCTFEVKKSSDVRQTTERLAGNTVEVTFVAAGSSDEQTASAQLLTEEEVQASRQTDEPKGYLGVVPSEYIIRRATWSAPIVAVGVTGQFTKVTFEGIGRIFADLFRGNTETAKEQVTGIVGIGYTLDKASERGFATVLLLVAVISLSLAIMNILPIPALDGGRLFVTLLFRALKRPLKKETEERIHGTGFALLMLLFFLITVIDVQRFILN
jgi:regulator of sigma E protease